MLIQIKKFQDFLKTTVKTPELQEKFDQMTKEAQDSRSGLETMKSDAMDTS